jgi:hypothetical protein
LWREEYDDAQSWTNANELAAIQCELTDAWSRLIFTALGGKPKGKPLTIQRPEHFTAKAAAESEQRTRNKVTSLSDMSALASFFGRTGEVL